jgi:hypothetical protein
LHHQVELDESRQQVAAERAFGEEKRRLFAQNHVPATALPAPTESVSFARLDFETLDRGDLIV